MNKILRYRISSWRQLTRCLSNNSKDFQINVSELCNNTSVNGTLISVSHKKYGTLFACLINCSGNLLTPENFEYIQEMTTEDILKEVRKFGFYVEFEPERHINSNQLEYLRTIQKLGYDKIRLIVVYTYQNGKDRVAKIRAVAFNIKDNPDWLNNAYSCSEKEYLDRLKEGSVIDLSNISESKNYNWTWLDYVANIQDILDNNNSEYNDIQEYTIEE